MLESPKLLGSVRIIAGQWRGRKLSFNNKNQSLRPTPVRVRETLFNWLEPVIRQAVCLDLYAGSGILGFEALSRGAKAVVAIDHDRVTCAHILKAQQLLQANLIVQQCEVLSWLMQSEVTINNLIARPVDIVFLDPPYRDQVLLPCLSTLNQYNWLSNNSLIYFESDNPIINLPDTYMIVKHSKAGQVYYYLLAKAKKL